MKPTTLPVFALVSCGALLLTACSGSPQDQVEAACEKQFAKNGEGDSGCSCFATALAEGVSETRLEQIAKLLNEAENKDQVGNQLQTQLGMDGALQVAGAAKKCSVGR